MENPAKNYPKAVFIGAAITVIIFVLGTFALGIIIPEKDINLTQSLLVALIITSSMSMLRGCRLSSPWLGIRCAGRRVDLGGRSVQRYLRSGQSRLSASLLPEDQRQRRTEKHSTDPRPCRNLAQPAVRCDAFRTEFLPNPVTAHRIALPHHVSADVQRRHLSALQYEKGPAPVPHRQQRQRTDVLIGGLGFCGSLLAFVLSFIPPSQIAVGSNTVWFAVLIIAASW